MSQILYITGNVVKDVQMSEKGVATVNVRVVRPYKNKETGKYDSDFIRLKAFGEKAKFIKQYFADGKPIGVKFEIRNNKYEKEGQTIYSDEYIVQDVDFPPTERKAADGSAPAAAAPAQSAKAAAPEEPPAMPTADESDDDMPF